MFEVLKTTMKGALTKAIERGHEKMLCHIYNIKSNTFKERKHKLSNMKQ